MPNLIAYAALLAWPLVTAALFRKLPAARASVWSLLVAFLLLPPGANIDLPLVPALDKVAIPNLTVFLLCLPLLWKSKTLIPQSRTVRLLLAVYVLAPVGTVLTNPEPLVFGERYLPGLRPYDVVSVMAEQILRLLPFLVGQALLADEAAQRDLLWAFVIGTLVYSLPMLVEVRLSPQLNVWLYGFFPHSFGQQMRFGGFRPVVFLGHGLWVAMFAATGLMAAAILWRRGTGRQPGLYFLASLYLLGVLILAKTVGPILYTLIGLPVLLILSRRQQIRIAAIFAAMMLAYPILRGADYVPTETLVAKAALIQDERASSLQFRFDNEDILLAKAQEKPLFGWGGYGRNRVYDINTGKDLSVTDGTWIIILGAFGWAGYLAVFGLLATPILMLWRFSSGAGGDALSPISASLAVILALNLVDLLPNSYLTPLTWLFAGAVLGSAEQLKAPRPKTLSPDPDQSRPATVRDRNLAFARDHRVETSTSPPLAAPEPASRQRARAPLYSRDPRDSRPRAKRQ